MAPQVAEWSRIHLPVQENQETQVQSLDRENPLESEMTLHFSILDGKIPWVEEPSGLQSMGPQRDTTEQPSTQVGVHDVSLQVQQVWGLQACGQHTILNLLPPGGGFSICRVTQRYCCVYPLMWEMGPCPRAALDCVKGKGACAVPAMCYLYRCSGTCWLGATWVDGDFPEHQLCIRSSAFLVLQQL